MERVADGTTGPLRDSVLAPQSPDLSPSPPTRTDGPIGSTPDATDRKPASPRPFLIVALVVLLGIVALLVYVMRRRGQESTDDAQVEGDVVTISVRVPGLVVAVPAEDNHRVKKGDLLAQVDETDWRAGNKPRRSSRKHGRRPRRPKHRAMVAVSAKGGIAAGQALVASSYYTVRSAYSSVLSARAAVDVAEGSGEGKLPAAGRLSYGQRSTPVEARRGTGRGQSGPHDRRAGARSVERLGGAAARRGRSGVGGTRTSGSEHAESKRS